MFLRPRDARLHTSREETIDQLTGRVGWVNLHARDLFFRLIFVKIMKSKGGVNIEDESEWNLKKWIGEVEF